MAISFKNPEALRTWIKRTTEAAEGIGQGKGNILNHSIYLATAVDRMVDLGIISRANANQIRKYKGLNEGATRVEHELIECIEMLYTMFSTEDEEGVEPPAEVATEIEESMDEDEDEDYEEDEDFEEDEE